MRIARLVFALGIGFLATAARAAETQPGPAADKPAPAEMTLRVMSFNIRCSPSLDGQNSWEFRKDAVVNTIRGFNPDLLGVQEATPVQVDFLRPALTGYGFVGVGRDDGKRGGEFSAIFFREDRFEKLDEGFFWLSETPHLPGSVGWDAAITRVVSWVWLSPKDGKGYDFHYFNTHFDHMGRRARPESARLLRRRIDGLGRAAAIIVTGDFNLDAGSEPYRALVNGDASKGSGPPLLDTYRVLHPERGDNEGTFHSFTGKTNAARIDWILCSPRFTVTEAAIDTAQKDGRYPSDHFPVTAVVRLAAPQALTSP
jgi:endonuclease/exonuclease/phosphatase family metal-dependent hydrolase